jgi:hypothetical protein
MIKGMIKEKGIKPIDIIEAVKELKRRGFVPKEQEDEELTKKRYGRMDT